MSVFFFDKYVAAANPLLLSPQMNNQFFDIRAGS